MIAVFNDAVDVADMNAFAAAAEDARHGFIDFDDDLFSLLSNGFRCRYSQAKVEETVFIHRADRDKRNVNIEKVAIHRRFIAVAHGDEVHLAEGTFFPVVAAHMPVHRRKGFPFRILFNDLPRSDGKTHANFYILQFIATSRQSLVEKNRLGRTHTIVYPIAGFYDFYSLFSGHQFLFVHICPLGHRNHPFHSIYTDCIVRRFTFTYSHIIRRPRRGYKRLSKVLHANYA